MTPTGQKLEALAIHAWSANLPVSWVLSKAIELKLHRAHIKRFVETVYHTWDMRIEYWYETGEMIQ